MKYSCILLLLFSVFSHSHFAQEDVNLKRIDSLKSLEGVDKIEVLNRLAFTFQISHADSSLQYAQAAWELLKQYPNDTLKIEIHNRMAVAQYIKTNYESCLQHCKDGLKLCNSAGLNEKSISFWNLMGVMERDNNQLDKALEYYLKALKICEDANMEARSVGIIANIGGIYQTNGQYQLSYDYYNKAFQKAKTLKDDYNLLVAGNASAFCLRKLKRLEAAKSILLEIRPTAVAMDLSIYIAGIDYGLGSVYQRQGNDAKALAYFRSSLHFNTIAEDAIQQSISAINLGISHMRVGQIDSAEYYVNYGYNLAQNNNYVHAIEHALLGKAKLSFAQGDFNSGDDLIDQYDELLDSAYNEENQAAIADMMTKYETKQKEQALAIAELDNEQKTYQLIGLGVFAFALLMLVLYIFNRRKKELAESQFKALKAIEQERVRIARDLHDHLGAELTLITSKLDMQAYAQQNQQNKNELEELSEMTRTANHQLRETIWSINKFSITIEELSQKISDHAKRLLSDSTNVEWTMEVSDENNELSPNVALNLYRIAQEILHNAFKYADAGKWHLTLSKGKLTIEDNGKGFDKTNISKGYGLQNIEQRAKEIDYSLSCSTAEGKGTRYDLVARG